MTTNQEYHYGLGKRKCAIAQAKLVPGAGEIIINGKPVNEYFGGQRFTPYINQPLEVTETKGKFNAMVKVTGGGLSGQAGAVRHAIARAVLVSNEGLRRPLRAEGLLTRDARVKERKKPGLKRARKAPQYTKR
ncbi:MAG TPA: 30S ribosomal protein S9 [Chloroflexota bacterium]|jgi:small subunit ribosomal protein S9|nr:30S ribosomal protein S9 [Chloroflexota bacterium]